MSRVTAPSPVRRSLAAIALIGLLLLATWLVSRAGREEQAGGGAHLDSAPPATAERADPLRSASAEGSRAEAPVLATDDAGAGARAGARTTRVVVRVAESLQRDAERVGGVRVAVGLLRREVGGAREAFERGLPPVALAGPASAPNGLVDLREGRVGEDGELAFDLEVPAGWFAEEGGVLELAWASVNEVGYQARARDVVLERSKDTVLRLVAWRGNTLHGRLVDEAGAPVAKTRVRLLAPDEDAVGGWASTHDADVSDGDGRFVIQHNRVGPRALLAMARDQGSAFRADLVFEEGAIRAGAEAAGEVELVVRAGGSLSGRLVDPRGDPVPGHRLWALPASWSEEPRAPRLNDAQRFERVRDAGLMDGYATSDAEGRFAIHGLAPGDYHLYGYDGPAERFGPRLTKDPVPLGSRDLRLEVTRHGLLVRVLEFDGRPVTPRVSRYGGTVRAEPVIHCMRLDAKGRVASSGPVSHTVEDGAVVFELVPGEPHGIVLLSQRHPRIERTVVVPPDVFTQELVLNLAEPSDPGVLELFLAGPDGAGFDEAANVRVRSLATGKTLHQSESRFRGPEFSALLPAGRYRVDVDVEPRRGHHGEVLRATPHAPTSLEVEVQSGEAARFDVRLGASGRLQVLAHLCEEAGLAKADDAQPESTERLERLVDDLIRGAEVTLLPKAGGRPLQPSFDVSNTEANPLPFLGGWQTSKAPDGIEVQSVNPIPIGWYTARFEAPGCATREREVEIRAGAVSRIELRL